MNRYFDSYGSDPRRIQYAGSETDGFSVDYKVIEFSLAKLTAVPLSEKMLRNIILMLSYI